MRRKVDPLRDFRNFLARAWEVNGLPEPTRLQYFLANQMQHGPRRLVVLCFRGFGKSWIGATRGNHALYCDKDRNFMNISAAQDKAVANSFYMKGLFALMPETKHLIPEREQRSSSLQFDVAGSRMSQAPSVKALSLLSNSVTGSRASDILADDVESKENSGSLSMRCRVREKCRELGGYVLRSPGDFPKDEAPRICYLGTPQVEQSVYWTLEDSGYETIIIPARYPSVEIEKLYGDRLAPPIREDLEKNPSLRLGGGKDGTQGQPTEPYRFGEKELQEAELEAGPHGWALQFMLLPTLGDSFRFPLKLTDLIVADCDNDKAPEKQYWSSKILVEDLPCPGLTGDMWHGPNPAWEGKMMPYTGNCMGIDPSTGGTDELAYAVVKVLNSQVYVLDVGGFPKGDSEETMLRLAKVAKQFDISYVRVEKNFGMGMWSQLFRPILRNVHGACEIEDVHVTGKKEPRICGILEPIIAAHRMIVSPGAIANDIATAAHYHTGEAVQHQLFYQMSHITREPHSIPFDDRVDALALAVSAFEEALDRDFKIEMMEREADEMDDMLQEWNERSLFMDNKPEPSFNWMD